MIFTRLLSFFAPYGVFIVGILVVALAAQTYRVDVWQTKTAAAKSQCETDKKEAVEAALVDSRIEAGITAKRLSELKAKDEKATEQLAKLEADKLISDASSDRLRDRIKAYAAAARAASSNPAPVAPSASAPVYSDPAGLLADLSGGLNEIAGVFAKYADEQTIKLERCNAQYDSLERTE